MSEQNKDVALKFIDAMGRSDPDAAATCLAPDAFTLAMGFSKFSGVRKRETILGTIAAFQTMLPTGLSPEIKTVIGEGDRVAVEFVGHAKTAEGKDYNNEYCMVFSLENGQIKQINEYFCTKLAEDVLWPLLQSMEDQIPTGG